MRSNKRSLSIFMGSEPNVQNPTASWLIALIARYTKSNTNNPAVMPASAGVATISALRPITNANV